MEITASIDSWSIEVVRSNEFCAKLRAPNIDFCTMHLQFLSLPLVLDAKNSNIMSVYRAMKVKY